MAVVQLRPAAIASAGAPAPARRALLALLGFAVCAAAVVGSASGAQSDAAFGRGLLQLLIVGTPIVAGLYALRAPVNAGFGVALLFIGVAWSFTALGESSSSVPYTIGRMSTWLVFPCVVFLLLAFPEGRIAKGLDRLLFVGVLGLLVFLFLGTTPFVQAFPPKTLWATCTTDCPPNALFVLDAQPAFLTKLVYVREWLIGLLWLGLFVSMYRRWRAASPLQRQAMGPVFVAGALLGVCHIAHHATRQLGVSADTVIAISSAWTVCIVAVCATFLVGLVRRRILLADALAKLGGALRPGVAPSRARDALATAVRDSTMQLLIRDARGAWLDAGGRPAASPESAGPGRAVTVVAASDDGREEVVLVHDVALRDDTELLDGVKGIVGASWRHERLVSDLAGALGELEDSRRRIAEAADVERARIERDLHDGAQQRLIALRIRLGMAEELLESDPVAGARQVRELGFEVERALEELRSLAHGVYPSLLVDRGLPDALRALARAAPMRVLVEARGVSRHPVEVESAIYFTCVEALQNAMKHATPAHGVWITLDQSETTLRFEVRDDGPGFATAGRSGRGLRHMRDRVEAVGGRLVVESAPGRGTRVTGEVDVGGAVGRPGAGHGRFIPSG